MTAEVIRLKQKRGEMGKWINGEMEQKKRKGETAKKNRLKAESMKTGAQWIKGKG
jgi:hypothetical protein